MIVKIYVKLHTPEAYWVKIWLYLSANIAQVKLALLFTHTRSHDWYEKPQRSPLRLRFYTSTLESASYAIGIVIYETLYLRFNCNCENMEQLPVY